MSLFPPLAGMMLIVLLAACTPASDAANTTPSDPPIMLAPDAGMDDDAIMLPPDAYHGNWRLVAADDPHDQALMALTIQSSAGEAQGSGDYVLHQPFCDAIAGQPITGMSDCELIGQSAAFDLVQATPAQIVLRFHPTADGADHRLVLHRDDNHLAGSYIAEANDIHLPVLAQPAPDEAH